MPSANNLEVEVDEAVFHSVLLGDTVWRGQIFDGDWREAKRTLVVREPATGASLGEVGASDPADLVHTVDRARQGTASPGSGTSF